MQVPNSLALFFFIVYVQIGVVLCEDTNALLLRTIENHERMLQHLSEVISKQDRRIAELERNCVPEKKTSDVIKDMVKPDEEIEDKEIVGSSELKFYKLINSIGQTGTNQTSKSGNPVRRLLIGSTPSTEPLNTIGFYAYLGTHDTTPAANKVIVFDTVKVNVANAYNRYSGVFTAPEAGAYVFSWTMECDGYGNLFTHVVRNNEVLGSIATDSGHESEYRMSTGLVLVLANKGDAVFVRVHSVHHSTIHSSGIARSTFSGWKIN